MKYRVGTSGFALPTVVISSLILMTVLVAGLSIATSTRTSLQAQYYDQLIRESAEAGTTFAQACLEANNYTPQWTNAKPLTPSTDCSGNVLGSCASGCYVYSDAMIRMSFQVNLPTTTGDGYQLIQATGSLSQLRTSNGAVVQTRSNTVNAQVNIASRADNIRFGYYDGTGGGAYFFTIDNLGAVKGVGGNNLGQLGIGNTTNTLTPVAVNLTSGTYAPRVFTSFVAAGSSVIFTAPNGLTYAAGKNTAGQLGIGSTATTNAPTRISTGTSPIIPAAAEPIVSAVIADGTNFILGADHNLYAAGDCDSGMTGYTTGCTAGISNKYRRVGLPTYNAGNPGTIPTAKLVADWRVAYIIMEGGQVYGWGTNVYDQLALLPTDWANPYTVPTSQSTPVRMGVFGDTGQPKAVQVATDGVSVWILDSNGVVWSAGQNNYGQLSGHGIEIRKAEQTLRCFDADSISSSLFHLWDCDKGITEGWTFYDDNSIRLAADTTRCITSAGSAASGLSLSTCNGAVLQKFELFALTPNSGYMKIRLKNYTGRCIENTNNDGSNMRMAACNGGSAQQMELPSMGYNDWESTTINPHHLYKVKMPAAAGTAVKISTDQWSTSVLDSNGVVWSFGLNNAGQLGNGGVTDYQAFPVKYIVPNGVVANDVIATCLLCQAPDYADIYVITTAGDIYSTGSNKYGQLGTGSMSPVSTSTPVKMLQLKDPNNIPTIPAPARDRLSVGGSSLQTGYGTVVIFGTDGKVYALGNNQWGQLGDGTTTNSATPTANQFTNPPQSTVRY